MTVIYSLDAYRTVYVHPSRAHAYTITIGPGSKQAKTCQNRPSSTYVSTRFLSRAPKCDGALTPTFRCALRNARSRSLSARSLKCPIAYVNEYRCGCVHVVYIHIGVSHIIVFLCFDFHATVALCVKVQSFGSLCIQSWRGLCHCTTRHAPEDITFKLC